MAGTNIIAPLIILFFAVFFYHKTNEINILVIDQVSHEGNRIFLPKFADSCK